MIQRIFRESKPNFILADDKLGGRKNLQVAAFAKFAKDVDFDAGILNDPKLNLAKR